MTSAHYRFERQEREALIKKIGYGKIIKRTTMNNFLYTISTTGIITVMDKITFKIVTRLIARPAQIRKYYGDQKPPYFLIQIARKHKELGYNCV
jgi:hypothetical protein